MKSGLMAICAASILGGTAVAQPPIIVSVEPVPTERVSYADLNLASANDVQRLTYRVRGAINRVCAPQYSRETFVDYHDCRSYAWGGAKPQMDRAILRAQQIARGISSIAPVAILIAVPQK
jgi:UrcA family protein